MNHIFRGIFLIQFLCSGGIALQSPPSAKPQLKNDYVLVDFRDVPLSFTNYSYNGLTKHTSRKYTAFVAVLPSSINNNFSFELPHGGELSACMYCEFSDSVVIIIIKFLLIVSLKQLIVSSNSYY